MADANVKISYLLKFDDGNEHKFIFEFDPKTFYLKPRPQKLPREWVKLEYCQCEHCPLKKTESPNCPIAENLADVADEYANLKSYKEVTVLVQTKERNYIKKVALQEALYSMFGLVMATSRCPHMDFLRPLARFHLPFSSYDETIVRTLSFYLLRQYLKQKNGGGGDYSVKGLQQSYEQVQLVNSGFLNRVRSFAKGDAHLNSVVILNGFVQLINSDLSSGFANLDSLFPD